MDLMAVFMVAIFPAIVLLYALGKIFAAGSQKRWIGVVLAAGLIGWWSYVYSTLSRIH